MRAIWSGSISFGPVSAPVAGDDVLVAGDDVLRREIRRPEAVGGDTSLTKTEVELAKPLVENLGERFDPEKYDDNYRKELLELIRAETKGQKLREPQEGEVVDPMAALRDSVERTQKQKKKKKKAKRPAKKAS